MKLPAIEYSRAAGSQTISPAQAAAPELLKAKAIGSLVQTTLDVTKEVIDRKNKSDTARLSALYVDSVTDAEADLAAADVVSRDELISKYGMEDTDARIQWQDQDGNKKQSFKRYEVEAAVMESVLESRLVEYAGTLNNSDYKSQWIQNTREANARAVVGITSRSAASAKQFEYKSALSSLEELNTSPQAQLEFAKTTPALDGNPDVRQKYINRAKSSLYDTKVNAIINNGTDAEIEKQIDKMKDPEQRAKLPVSEKEVRILQTRAQTELDRRQREQDIAEGKALKLSKEQEAERTKVAKESYDNIVVAKSLGMTVTEEKALEVEGAVAGTEYQDKLALLNDVEEFAVLSRADREAEMAGLDDGSLDDVDRYQAYAKSSELLAHAAAGNGYQLGESQGLIENEPLDIFDSESVDTRREQARFLSDHYGVPVSPFSEEDIRQISGTLNTMTPLEQADMTVAFRAMPEVWSQFSKAGHEVFAWSGAAGDRELSVTALSGQKIIDSGDAILPSKNEHLLASNEYLGNVYGTQDKSAVMKTALAVYAKTTTAGAEGEFDPDAWDEALKLTTGGIGEVNGNKVAIPRDTDEDTMQDYVDTFSPERVQEFGGVAGMDNEVAAKKIQDGTWISVGDGQYRVDIGNQTLMKGPGEVLIIEYNREVALDMRASKYGINQQRIRNARAGRGAMNNG